MAARPPSNDMDDGPDVTEFGIAALDAAVEDWDVSFPLSAEELRAEYGEEHIAIDVSGHEMSLDTALADCPQRRFDDKQDLLNALHPIFETERERLSNSLLGQLRALLPF